MGSLVVLSRAQPRTLDRVHLLLAGENAEVRSLVATRAREAVDGLAVHEAHDGAEAVRIGLQRQPQLALLDVGLPRLGGIEVANTLRGLRPQMRFALHTEQPDVHPDRAREHWLPIFDTTLDLEDAIRWVEAESEAYLERPGVRQRRNLRCAVCGYGIVRAAPPERCPMCHGEHTWVHAPWRPFVVEGSLR
jgi:CheY-like chemotaxis protein